MSDDDRRPQWPTDITKGAAAEWRRERDAKGASKPDREGDARALWRDAQTPELRAHLRKIYPDLFASEPDPKPRREQPARVNLPDGFDFWPSAKRDAWRAEVNRLTAAQKERRP